MSPHIQEIMKLSVEERIRVVEGIWDSIADDVTLEDLRREPPLPERNNETVASAESDSAVPWNEAYQKLLSNL